MAISFQIKSVGVTGQRTDFARTVLRVGVCTGGVSGTVYELDPGQDPQATLGYGPLAVADMRASRYVQNAQRYALKVAGSTAGSISAVTQSGSGPLLTVAGMALDGLSATPYLAMSVKAKVRTAGALGTAQLDVALDGASYDYTFDVPAATPATVIGTVDTSAFTWGAGGTLDGLTVIIGAATCTFNDPADSAAMLSQLELAISGYGFDLVQGKYLRVRKDTLGAASTFTIDSASTADTVLGLSTAAATGSASTITIAAAGLVITCPTGTYVLDEVYSFTTTAPRCSLSAITTAITAAGLDTSLDFGLIAIMQTPLDEIDARAYADALDALCAAWEAAEDKRFVMWLLGSPLDTADADLKLAMLSHVSRHGAMAHKDCYIPSVVPQAQGLLRASAVEALANRCAAQDSFSEDPGYGGFGSLDCSLKSADLATTVRLESTASIKMGKSTGPGFTTITSKSGLPYFTRGVTRAGQTRRFVDVGVKRAPKAMAAVLWQALRRIENPTFDLNKDGTIQEADAVSLEEAFATELQEKFIQPKHFSRIVIQVNRAEVISTTRNVTINWTAQIRGQGENITGVLSVAGVIAATN